jgi:uncharacterized protein (TIGR00369 family)
VTTKHPHQPEDSLFDGLVDGEPYPPPHHVLRQLPAEIETVAERRDHAWLRVDPSDPTSYVSDLVVTVDVLGGFLIGPLVDPDWMATADLSLHLGAAPRSGTVLVAAEALRLGRTSVVVGVELYDGDLDGPGCGQGVLAFTRLPRRAENLHLLRPEPGTRTDLGGPEAVPGSVVRGLPVEVVDAASGRVVVPVEPWARNSFGAMNGGVVAALAARAGAEMASAVQRQAQVVTDVVVHYMAPAAVGPLTTAGTLVRAGTNATAVRIDMFDTGRHGDDGAPRPVVLAHVATAQP